MCQGQCPCHLRVWPALRIGPESVTPAPRDSCDWEQRDFKSVLSPAKWSVKWGSPCRRQSGGSSKNPENFHLTEIPLLGSQQKTENMRPHENLSANVHGGPIHNSKSRQRPKRPWAEERRKMGYDLTMEHSQAVERSEVLTRRTVWNSPEITRSLRSQTHTV